MRCNGSYLYSISGRGMEPEKRSGIGRNYWRTDRNQRKIYLSQRTAFNAAAAWSTTRRERFLFQGDFVFHNFNVLKRAFEVRRGDLPLYYGVGARLRTGRDDTFGVRFVVGMAYIFPSSPFDIFLEVAPIMNLIPATELDGGAAIGFRIWFN